jgi:hypothetical protein
MVDNMEYAVQISRLAYRTERLYYGVHYLVQAETFRTAVTLGYRKISGLNVCHFVIFYV